MKSNIRKLLFLLTNTQKKNLLILAGLLLIGVLFEMAGLGIMIPALALMLKDDIGAEYPSVKPLLYKLGDPTHAQLVAIGMSLLIFVYVVKSIYLFFLYKKQFRFTTQLCADLARNLFEGYLKQPYAFHLQRNSAILMRNIQLEVNTFNATCQSFMIVTTEIIIVLGSFFILVLVEPVGAIVVSVFLTASAFGFHYITRKKLFEWGRQRQVNEGAINQHLMQGLGGVKEVKLMGRDNYFTGLFNIYNQRKARTLSNILTVQQIPRLYLELLAMVGLAGLIIMMIIQGKSLNTLLPVLGIFIGAAFRMIPSVSRVMSGVQVIKVGQSSLDLFYSEFKMLRETEQKRIESGLNSKLCFEQGITLSNLNFAYPVSYRNALENVSIKINKGELVGFIGPSGSGKSTIIDVILGLLTPNSGKVILDGIDIQKGIRSWQDKIGYVPQSVYLTDDSLRRNVAFGIANDIMDESAVIRAIRAAQLEDFVALQPNGLDTNVGERGVRLSGGQRQRIGIARALYHDPEVLVLDEATSALDIETETGVMEAVMALQGSKTIIIVAHRISTVENCDKLFVLDNGRITLEGKPSEILSRKTIH